MKLALGRTDSRNFPESLTDFPVRPGVIEHQDACPTCRTCPRTLIRPPARVRFGPVEAIYLAGRVVSQLAGRQDLASLDRDGQVRRAFPSRRSRPSCASRASRGIASPGCPWACPALSTGRPGIQTAAKAAGMSRGSASSPRAASPKAPSWHEQQRCGQSDEPPGRAVHGRIPHSAWCTSRLRIGACLDRQSQPAALPGS